MRPVTLGKILLFVLLFSPAEQILTQSTSQPAESQNFVSAEISSHEFGKRQLPWLMKHPDLATTVITKSQFEGSKQVNRIYRPNYPTLDVYSSSGAPLFFSDSSEANVKVIDALPLAIPAPDLNPRYQVRPSLREALSMIPTIARSDWATPPQIDYTIVAFISNRAADDQLQSKNVSASQGTNKTTQPQNMNPAGPKIHLIAVPSPHPDLELEAARRNALANRAEDEAIQRLRTRLNGSRIRVIEVRIMER